MGREDAFPHHSEWRWWGWRWPGGRCFAPRCCPWSLCKLCRSSWMERMKKCHKPELSLCHIYSSIPPPTSCYVNALGWYSRPQTCKPDTSSLFMCWTSCTKLHTRAYQTETPESWQTPLCLQAIISGAAVKVLSL